MTRLALLAFVLNCLMLQLAALGPRIFDTNQWLCSAKVNFSQLKVHFYEVNHKKQEIESPSGNAPLTYLLLNMTNWDPESDFKWCIFQMSLTHSQDSKRFWACKADSIFNLAEQLVLEGNIASVLNVTDRIIDGLKANDSFNMQAIRQMIGCTQEATKTTRTKERFLTIGFNSTKSAVAVNSSQLANEMALSTESSQPEVSSSGLARAKRHDHSNSIGHIVTSTGGKCHGNGSTNCHENRSPTKPLMIIISVVVAVVVFLLCYIYVCDGPRIGRETSQPNDNQSDVSLVASFAKGKSELKAPSNLVVNLEKGPSKTMAGQETSLNTLASGTGAVPLAPVEEAAKLTVLPGPVPSTSKAVVT